MTPASSLCPAIRVQFWADRLKEAARSGVLLDLAETPQVDPSDAAGWSADRCIPAVALRRVLASADAKNLDPRGLRIRGARFSGDFTLAHIDFPRPLHFLDCAFPESADLSGAKLKELSLAGSHTGALVLDQAVVTGDVLADALTSAGEVSMCGIQIGGRLVLTGAKLSNEDGSALNLDSARIAGEALLNKGFEARGEVIALAVRIGGQLNLIGATLENAGKDALSLDSAEISGGLIARKDKRAGTDGEWKLTAHGTVRGLEAEIGGPVELDGAELGDPNTRDGHALYFDRAEIAGKLVANNGFQAFGTVRAVGAKIKGQCDFDGAILHSRGEDGYALDLDGADIASSLTMSNGFKAYGRVSAVAAGVKGRIDLGGATIIRPGKDALDLDRAEISGDVVASGGCEIHGTVRALAARIGGQLDLSGSTFRRPGDDGAVFLKSAAIRRLVLRPTHLDGLDISRTVIGDLEVGRDLPTPVIATGWKVEDIDGSLRDDPDKAKDWLKTHPEKVKPVQPWWALADVYERNGDPAAARRMRFLAAKEVSRQSPWKTRYLRRTYGFLVGYGYYPLKALYSLAAVLVLGVGIVIAAREHVVPTNTERAVAAVHAARAQGWPPTDNATIGDVLARRGPLSSRPPTGQTPCSEHPGYPCWEPITFTINSLIPAWGMPTSDWTIRGPFMLTFALAVLKIVAWGLFALLLAGVTGLLRKT